MNAIELAKAKTAAIEAQKKLDAGKAEGAKKAEPDKVAVLGRIFFARLAHSKFIFSDNVEVIFAFGRLEVSPKTFPGTFQRPTGHGQQPHPDNGRPKWQVYMEELNAIVPPQGTNPNIFTQDTWEKLEELPVPDQNAVDEVTLAQAENQITRTGNIKVEQQTGAVAIGGAPVSANVSSIDQELLNAARKAGATPVGNTDVITRIDPDKLPPTGAASSVG